MTDRRWERVAGFYPRFAHRMAAWAEALGTVPAVTWEGSWIRDVPAVRLRRRALRPAPRLLEPVGYRFAHGRYHRRDAFPALYLADGRDTAWAEVFGATSAGDAVSAPLESRLALRVDGCLRMLVDLRDGSVQELLGVTTRDLTEAHQVLVVDALGRFPGYELTQCLCEIGHSIGLGGFVYPSAATRRTGMEGSNVVIFPDNLERTGSWYQVTDPVTGVVERWPLIG